MSCFWKYFFNFFFLIIFILFFWGVRSLNSAPLCSVSDCKFLFVFVVFHSIFHTCVVGWLHLGVYRCVLKPRPLSSSLCTNWGKKKACGTDKHLINEPHKAACPPTSSLKALASILFYC